MHALSVYRSALPAVCLLLGLWMGCAGTQRPETPAPPSDLSEACLEGPWKECSDALSSVRRGELEAPPLEVFWVTLLLTTPDVGPRAVRELGAVVGELHPKSPAAGVLEKACFKGDVVSCRHLAATHRDEERPFWGAMACKLSDVDACLALAPTPEAMAHQSRAKCTPTQRARCWDRAQDRAKTIRGIQASCEQGNDAMCWGLIAQRMNVSAPISEAALAQADRMCACDAVTLPSGAAYHAMMRARCVRVDAARNTARLRARFNDGLKRCVEGDTKACEPTAALVREAPLVVPDGAPTARGIVKALRTRGCRAGDAFACWGLKKYDQATPALEDACASGDHAACGRLGARRMNTRETASDGHGLLRAACAARDYAACHSYALHTRGSMAAGAGQNAPVRRLEHLTRQMHTCMTSSDAKRACAYVGATLASGQEPLPPSPEEAAPFLERACALGDVASCKKLTGDAQQTGLHIACLHHNISACNAYAQAVASTDIDATKRAWGRACRLGDHVACQRANIPLRVACMESTPTANLSACLGGCEEGDRTSCGMIARVIWPRPQVFQIVRQGDMYQIGQRIADALGKSCKRGSVLDCYAQAALIRGGHTSAQVADAQRYLRRREQLDPSALMRLTQLRGLCTTGKPRRACDAPDLVLVNPGNVERWNALAESADLKATLIERDALKRAERDCKSGDQAACAEVALEELHRLTRIEGKHIQQAPERWRDAFAKLDAACGAGVLHACRSLTQGVTRDGSPDLEAIFTRATERMCDLGEGQGCLLRAGHASRAQTSNAQRAAWYERGCALGKSEGCQRAADLWARGDGVTRDDARASALYERACALGAPDACYTPSWAQCADTMRGP